MRRLLILVIFAVAIAALVRFLQQQKMQWAALSDDEIRARLGGKLDGRMPPEQVDAIAEAIISKIRGAGYIAQSESDVAVDLTDEAAIQEGEAEEDEESVSEEATAS